MSNHGVSEAKSQFSKLVDRALKGEGVVITRRGEPVVELRPVRAALRKALQITDADLDWLQERRIGRLAATIDAGTLVSQMRDEEEH